jgi:hypothetical protein
MVRILTPAAHASPLVWRCFAVSSELHMLQSIALTLRCSRHGFSSLRAYQLRERSPQWPVVFALLPRRVPCF